jgi:hypothetical protein
VRRASEESGKPFESFVREEKRNRFYDDLFFIFTSAIAIWSDIWRHNYHIVVNDGVPDQLEEGWNHEIRLEGDGGTDRICFFPKILIYSKRHSKTFCGRCYIPPQQALTAESSPSI